MSFWDKAFTVLIIWYVGFCMRGWDWVGLWHLVTGR